MMNEALKDDDLEQLLAQADELIEQINAELAEYREDAQQSEIAEQARRLKAIRTEVRDRAEKKAGTKEGPYSEGMHEAIDDLVEAMKSLAKYLS